MGVYILDTNFFIQAHRLTYPLDVAASFWNKLAELAAAGKVISIDKVKNEIYNNDDELKEWCEANLPNNFFKDTSGVLSSYSQVVNWANSRSSHYIPQALNEFLDADEADAWLVAFAHADSTNRCLVTYEIPAPDGKKKIKIPEACGGVSVQYLNPIEMFRQLNERF